MLRGFYLLTAARLRRRCFLAVGACVAAALCLTAALRTPPAPDSVPVSAAVPEAPYIARLTDERVIITHDGEIVLMTAIDVRTLPQADRDALAAGIALPDAAAIARLLEDYTS